MAQTIPISGPVVATTGIPTVYSPSTVATTTTVPTGIPTVYSPSTVAATTTVPTGVSVPPTTATVPVSATETTTQKPVTTTMTEPHWSGVFGFMLAVIALILAIIALVIAMRDSTKIKNITGGGSSGNTTSNNWSVTNRNVSTTTDTFTATPNSIYINNSSTLTTLTVLQGTSTVGSLFIIDNSSSGTQNLTITFKNSSGTVINPSSGVVSGNSRQYLWNGTGDNTTRRYWNVSSTD